MTLLHAVILGIVEGVSEFLPISSTAHLLLASRFLELPSTEFLKSFHIAIQLGAILSVVVLYWRTFIRSWEVLLRVLVAFLPTAVIGLLLHDFVKAYLYESVPVILWSLLLGGVFLIVFEKLHRERAGAGEHLEHLPWMHAVYIGLFQSIAIVPGVSRSAATIIGGLLLGMKRRTIVDFSFLLAVPTMGAAVILDVAKSPEVFTVDTLPLLATGFITSFFVATLCIVGLLRFIKKHDFTGFGVYRIVAAVVCWFVLR